MQRITAWVVLSLGLVVLVLGCVGLSEAVRDERGVPLVSRLLVLAVVAVAMVRAALELRDPRKDV